MIKRNVTAGVTRVQAWECTKNDHPGMLVYTQAIALQKMSEGFNIDIVAITRREGYAPTFEYGVLI